MGFAARAGRGTKNRKKKKGGQGFTRCPESPHACCENITVKTRRDHRNSTKKTIGKQKHKEGLEESVAGRSVAGGSGAGGFGTGVLPVQEGLGLGVPPGVGSRVWRVWVGGVKAKRCVGEEVWR